MPGLDVIRLGLAPLGIDEVIEVACHARKVEIDKESLARLDHARQLVFELAEQGHPVYGLNRGVGWNKDRRIEPGQYERFNRNLLYSHSAGVGPLASREEVRAVMLTRLNGLLQGHAGLQPEIVVRYADFLNRGIHPLLPLRGSIGAADITSISHIGLAMIGEGEVEYGGIRMAASEALELAGLSPIILGPKDGLAIVSSNALSAGTGALALGEAEKLLKLADLVYALSLEAVTGNVSPLHEAVHKVRPYPGQLRSRDRIARYLKGSELWDGTLPDSLQDPLSFRDACQIHGAAEDALRYAREQLELHLTSSDDNPCLLVEERLILSNANFDPVVWILGFEMLGIALHHLSKSSCHRIIKLGDPRFTGLTRFLTPDEQKVIGFCTLQKTATSLDAEIRHLINPVSTDFYSLAGDLEDHATNAPLVVRNLREIIERIYYILAIELLHAAQAVQLRPPGFRMGEGTRQLYEALREEVPFLSEDRILTGDIDRTYRLLSSIRIKGHSISIIESKSG
ncbi:HAL/PAL/TAL family ammonia-lyase [Paenibacillus brevis]|uniref:Aromatic amino acid ammonia-lyase n=1 Tax=Paenibacillus brevis TaxID=2841508 RepID=A0ABS6FUK2_9BACL|nr:aromatic amino acid ammonia-lyase [Paenibacillus brevis]MBU5673902.1 aromatic amino acid ammonia-lyase [Paenibacillus brevis]